MEVCKPGYTVLSGPVVVISLFDGSHLNPVDLVRMHWDAGFGSLLRKEAENLAFTVLADYLLRRHDFSDVFELTPPFARFAVIGRLEPSFFIETDLIAQWVSSQRRLMRNQPI